MINWQERKTYIGASESAAILGISPWQSAFDVWANKTDFDAQPQRSAAENERLYMGNLLESAIIKAYEKRYDCIVEPGKTFRHPEHSFLGANPDGMRFDAGINIECKNVSSFTADSFGEPETDEIPPYYIVQVQKQMGLSGLPVTHLAALFGGNTLKRYVIQFDKEIYDYIINAEIDFWQRYVVPRVPPPVTRLKDINRAFNKSIANAVAADADIMLACQNLKAAKARLKELEAAMAEDEAAIKAYLKENDTLIDDGQHVLATWKSAKGRVCFDAKKLETENPELYQKYAYTAQGSRRFLVK